MATQGENQDYTKTMKGAGDFSPASQKVTIHTMPKRYMTENNSVKRKARGTGMLILLFGFVFLVLGLAVMYKALKPEPSVEIDRNNQMTQNQDMETKQEPEKEKKTEQESKEENKKEDDEPINVPVVENNKEEAASSSVPTVDDNNAVGADYLEANDGDKDGLSDLEELLLGSSANSQDSDGDTYLDKVEVIGLYDPTSTGKLEDSVHIEVFENSAYSYSVFTSSVWTVETVHGYESLLIPLGQDQYFQIITNENEGVESIEQWYMDIFDVFELSPEQLYENGEWKGVFNETGLTVYLKHPSEDYIITFNYELGSDNTLYYKNMFDMMLASFRQL